jgi:predicted phosphodiesterase
MAQKAVSKIELQKVLNAVLEHGSYQQASVALDMAVSTVKDRCRQAEKAGLQPKGKAPDDPRVLKSKLKTVSKELKVAQNKESEMEIIKQAIGDLNDSVAELETPAWVSAPLKTLGSPGVPTLFASDFHWGERVNPKEIGGVNKYNVKIAQERLEYTVRTATHLLAIISPEMDFPGIVFVLGGDMVSGNIHEELMATNEIQSMPTVLDLFEHLTAAIGYLADTFGKVFIPCVSGNHGRDTHKIWGKLRNHTSFDWLLYQFLARHFKADKRISFHIPDGSDALYKVHGVRYLLTHGDQFRGGDSIIGALGPLTRGNQKKQARNQAVKMEYDVMICGHWHQYIHVERLIVNGSLKGYDEYAYQNNFGFEPPRQALWLTHPRFGITYRMPVLCERPAAVSNPKVWVEILGD